MALPSGETVTEQTKARFGISGLFIYLLGCFIHVAFLLIFALIDQWLLVYFNVFSVVVFALAGVLHTRGYVMAAFLLAMLEVPIHGALATVMMGSAPGFYFYLAGPPIAAWVFPFFDRRARILIVVAFSIAFAFLAAYSVYFEAHKPVGDGWAFGFKIANALGLIVLVTGWVGLYNDAMLRAEAALSVAHERSEKLLQNILPTAIADRLKGTTRNIGDYHDAATVMFADIVNFTEMAQRMPAALLVRMLNEIFSEFDDLAEEHGVEKIKTIGDAYMVTGGLPKAQPDHAKRVARYALAIGETVAKYRDDLGVPIQLRLWLLASSVNANLPTTCGATL
jgi:adenylate cyclase